MDQMDGIAKEQSISKGPKYRQIRNSLLQQFREGSYSLNEPLPGERSLAVTMNVAVGTLRQALHQLESDGFIRRVPGKGTFVNSPQEQRELMKTNVFSVIVPSISEDPYPLLAEGVEQSVEGRYRITVGSSQHNPAEQERLIRQAVKDKVAGVAIVPTADPTPPEHIRMLQDNHIPVVFCHRAVSGVDAPLVYYSFEQIGRMAAEILFEKGHRRIVSLMGMRYETSLSLSAGFRNAFEELGVEKSNFRVHYHGSMLKGNTHALMSLHRDATREALEQIFCDNNRPTAIYCGTPIDAELTYLEAVDLGLRIPKDLSLIYCGDNRPRGALTQRMTCISRDERDLGVQAGRLLCEMSCGRRQLDCRDKIEIPLELLSGETVGPPP